MNRIAEDLESTGQADRAVVVRSLVEPTPPPEGPRRFEPLPEIVPPPEVDGNAPVPPEATSAREEAARAYADLARRSGEADRLALADACFREVLRRLPDEPEARRVLGYVPHEGGWATPHAVNRLENGDIFHPTYGWIPSEYLPELERGLLPAPSLAGRAPSRWIPAADADRLRQGDIASGWQITTPHFKIQASVPLDEGIEFARKLESFFDLFTSITADVIGPERLQFARLVRDPDATAPAKAARQHLVYYFGSKPQYVDYLTRLTRNPKIKDTLGVYLDDRKTSYFFKDEGGELTVEATLYHEVSHQLLFELAGPSGYQRNAGNFWVFEGLGTYFETVSFQPDGSIRYGGRVGPRIAEARRRMVEEDSLIPIARFVTFDREEFNDALRGDPHLNYAESIALTVLLMDGDRRAYRDGFLDYAADAYRGRLRAGSSLSLASRVGMSYEQLDQELQEFLAPPLGTEGVAER
ncbi:DUF1570 domain-containing protein [Tautonia plasticadhaerens]|uniref:DUF1570 domain-containing protein n=1 Tax=Tautonia plasticadhaerens TaxID=2527974 RepID=UPI0011A7C634|nr:DUF1570 domain-containing protein [Tautonia plasticadhaerens]